MIDFSKVSGFQKREPASNAQLVDIEKKLRKKLPSDHKKFLLLTNGFYSNEVHLYSTDIMVERNVTYEVNKYCPDFINIGDDGGGSAILLSAVHSSPTKVFMVGHGSMDPSLMEVIGEDFVAWIQEGCPVELDK